MKRLYIALILYGLCAITTSQAQQNISYWGTDFWVGFLDNWHDYDVDKYYFGAVAPRPCTVTITNPSSGWSHTMNVTSGQPTIYQVANSSASQCWQAGSCIITNKGLHVTSTDSVMLYVFNESGTTSSCDATSVLPTPALGSKYVIQQYPVNTHVEDYYACFNVVAVENGTDVVIILSDATLSGHHAGDTLRVTLNAGQVYKVKGLQYTGDFSGTYIYTSNCKPIAVFSGSTLARIPSTAASGDVIVQQDMPVQSWGQNWVLPPDIGNSNTAYYRVTCYEDSCEVYFNGALRTTLQARQTYEIQTTTGGLLHTTKPAETFLYTHSRLLSNSGIHGDASGCPLTPMEQSIRSASFLTFPVRNRSPYSSEYYVAISMLASDTSLLRLNGAPITNNPNFRIQTVSSGYAYAICLLSTASAQLHNISTTGSGFVATAHGLGEDWEAYSMNVGCNAEVTYTPPTCDTVDTACCVTIFHFRGESFTQSGTYLVGDSCDKITLLNLSMTDAVHSWVDTSVCGNQFVWYGHTFTQGGNYIDTVTIPNVCDTVVHLNLRMLPTYLHQFDTASCTGTLTWDGTPLQMGMNSIAYTSIVGCDSIVQVNLSQLPSYEIMVDTTVCGGRYLWHDSLIITSGTYVFHSTTLRGCDSVVTQNVYLPPSYSTTIDTGSCTGSITWADTTFQDSGTYRLTTVDGCDSTFIIRVATWPHYDTLYYVVLPDTESYTWVNGETYNSDTDTTIVLQDHHGCDSVLRLVITVYSTQHTEQDTDYEHRIWVPNIFTPDRDINRVFVVKSRYVEEMTVHLFDRMGDWVCTFNGLTESWDGTKNGYPCKGGAYVYKIQYRTKDINGKHPDIVGTVVLLR